MFNLRMNSGERLYIWQADDWPQWRYDLSALTGPLTDVSRAQGLLLGRMADVGMALRDQASLAALTEDVVKTSEIEGEVLNVESVRSSIARRLGVDIGAVAPVDRHAVERAAGEAVEPATGRVRWQAHQQQVGGACQVFARHRIARHYPACGVRRSSKGAGWWS